METTSRKNNNSSKEKDEPVINGMAYELEYRGTIEKNNIVPMESYRPSKEDMGIEIKAETHVIELEKNTAKRIRKEDGKVISMDAKKAEKIRKDREKSGKLVNLEDKKKTKNTRATGTDER